MGNRNGMVVLAHFGVVCVALRDDFLAVLVRKTKISFFVSNRIGYEYFLVQMITYLISIDGIKFLQSVFLT